MQPDDGVVLFVAGARPNFVKLAPILRACAGKLRFELVHTGQHYDFRMSGVFFEQLGISAPDVRLEVGCANHAAIMAAFDAHLATRARRPKAVVVVGDVNSTMACALVAAQRSIAVAHIEAGLRSFDRAMPEEINRIVTDAVADLLLVSEPAGLDNLAREGVPASRVKYCGNVMIDSLVEQLPAARELSTAKAMELERGNYAIVTLHRPSNVDSRERLTALIELVNHISRAVPVVFPMHPRTRSRLAELGIVARNRRVLACDPLGYREFLSLMCDARLVITDSGGVQEETTYLGVPCVTMRTTTERPITLSHGTNTLVGEDLDTARLVIEDVLAGRRHEARSIEGWDGRAASRIVDSLVNWLAWSADGGAQVAR